MGEWRGVVGAEPTVKGASGEDKVRVLECGRLVWTPRRRARSDRKRKDKGRQEVLGPEAGLRQRESKKAAVRAETSLLSEGLS